jgi:hypothetical protein
LDETATFRQFGRPTGLHWGRRGGGVYYDGKNGSEVVKAMIELGRPIRRLPEKPGFLTYPQKWGHRDLLGVLWRSALVHRLGATISDLDVVHPFDAQARECMHRVDGEHPDPSVARLLFGPRWRTMWWRDGLSREALTLPPGDRWLSASRPHWGLGWYVVDIDMHVDRPTSADVERLEDRVRFFTSTQGMPKPDLIVTSKRMGRHCWYRAPGLGNPQDSLKAAVAMRSLLAWAAGGDEALAEVGVEVFPKSGDAMSNMPAIPFGAWSKLCDSHGKILEPDPLQGIVRWADGYESSKVGDAIPVRGSIMAESIRDAVRDALSLPSSSGTSKGKGNTVTVPKESFDASPITEKRHKRSNDDQDGEKKRKPEEVWEGGPLKAKTNSQLLQVARWIRWGILKQSGETPSEEAYLLLLSWVRRGNGTLRDESEATWRRRFRSAWRKALPLHASVKAGHLLYRSDVMAAVKATIEHLPKEGWRSRRHFLRVLLHLWTKVRMNGRAEDHDDVEIKLSSRELQRLDDHYAQAMEKLDDASLLALVKAGRAPTKRLVSGGIIKTFGEISTYVVKMPEAPSDDDTGISIDDPLAVIEHALDMLDDTTAIKLKGSRAWKAWRARRPKAISLK